MVDTYERTRTRHHVHGLPELDQPDAEWWDSVTPSDVTVATGSFEDSVAAVCAEARGAADFIEELCGGGLEGASLREGIRTFVVKAGASRSTALALLGVLDRELEATSTLLVRASGRSGGTAHAVPVASSASPTTVLIDWRAVNEAASSAPPLRLRDEDGIILTPVALSSPSHWPSEDLDD